MATTYSTSKSYASGKVDKKTKQNYKKYNQSYKASQSVQSAKKKMNGVKAPEEFSSKYTKAMEQTYDAFANRDKFQYDVNEDMLYQQLKDQYSALGKVAMQDTMGQAAAMTGGYGNSYGQTVGQQTYQDYMQQLQEQIPNLYQMAQDRYNQEGDQMLNQYNMARDMYDVDYGEYRDEKSDYYADRDYYTGLYQNERSFDYGQYSDNRNYWNGEYWNQKNAVQNQVNRSTTAGSGGSTNSSKSSSNKSDQNVNTIKGSPVPFSNEKVGDILTSVSKLGTEDKMLKELQRMYESGEISEGNLYYFMDRLGL